MDCFAAHNVTANVPPPRDAPDCAPSLSLDAPPPPPGIGASQPPGTGPKQPLAAHNVVAHEPPRDTGPKLPAQTTVGGGATPRAASAPSPWVDTSAKLMPAPSTTRSSARERRKRRQSFPPSAAVSQWARRALDAAWTREVPGLGNPFRTRLTRETCAQLGIPDYHAVVADVADLALCRERLAAGQYANDAALRSDVQRIAANARRYHGDESPFTRAADQLAAAFDAALYTTEEAPRTARRRKLFSPTADEGGAPPSVSRRRVVFSPEPPKVKTLPPTERGCVVPDKYACDGCGRDLGAGLRGFEVYATCGVCESDFCFACCDTVEPATGYVMRLGHDALCSAPLLIRDRNLEAAREDALLAARES